VADRAVVYRLIADASGVLAGTRQASASVRKLGDDITGAGKSSETWRKGLDGVGRSAGRVALVAAAGLGVMALKAANFEQAISNVAAATHESEENMIALRDAAIDAGARTAFSATEAAGAITELAKAGVETADILGKNGALSGALSLAAAGQIEVADAAEYTATALTQFQLAGTQATHVADLLAAGAGKAQGEVADIALALGYAGVPAANLGVSIEETTGALALFAKAGIIGERAGTSLRGMLSSLTSPSKLAAKTMGDLGIDMFNAQGKFIGLAGVAEQLQGRMKGLTDEERSLALGRIFGNEQLQAANVLYREGASGVKTWERNVDDAGFAAETAAIKTDNLRGDLERLGGAIDTALIKGGQGSQGFLRGLTQGATDAVDAFNKLPSSFSSAVSGMLAITAITGGGLWFGAKVIRGISDTREALANLGPAGTAAGRAMRTVTAAAGGFTVLLIAAEGIKAIQKATDEALPSLNTLTKQLLDLRAGEITSLSGEFDSLGDSLNRITDSEFSFKGIKHSGNLTGFTDMLQKPFEGLFGEAGSLRVARAEVDSIDQALANLVNNGNPDAAAEALTAIAQSSGLTADEMAVFRSQLPAYQGALDGMATSAELAADAHEGMGKKVKIAGQLIKFTEEQIKAAQEAYDKARENAAGVATGFFDMSKNIDKAKVSLGEWLGQIEKQAKALENFTANFKKAKEGGVDGGLLDFLAEQGPTGALRIQQLANAGTQDVAKANAAWKRKQEAIEAFVDATTEVPDELRVDVEIVDDEARRKERALRQKFNTFPKSVNTDLKVDNRQALAGIRAVEARIAEAFRDRVLKIRIEQNAVKLENAGRSPLKKAGGGAIYGPGTATSDSIPAYLSNGEYVVRAAAVAKYGTAMFDRLNAMHFAQGGQVGAGAASSAAMRLSRADIQALANAMLNARPLHGPVSVIGDGDFERQMRLSAALASKGGA
jgi:TP901 family phage tail tape measure protein